MTALEVHRERVVRHFQIIVFRGIGGGADDEGEFIDPTEEMENRLQIGLGRVWRNEEKEESQLQQLAEAGFQTPALVRRASGACEREACPSV